MKKWITTYYTDAMLNVTLLLLRVGFSILMVPHGYGKLTSFSEKQDSFMNFLGLGSSLSLSLVVFAEFFCPLFIIAGLFTRLSAIPIIITLGVALFHAHHGEIFGKGELPMAYLLAYTAILLMGPGKFSIDAFFSGSISDNK